MKISELKAGASGITITATVVQKSEPREVVTKFGKRVSVANITLKDDSGTITMSLWGDDINTVGVGDQLEVSNSYVGEFRGTPQLSTGKFGKIKVLEKGSGEATADYDSTSAEEENVE
jgi:ssDNA-binding replication factor A large subunit